MTRRADIGCRIVVMGVTGCGKTTMGQMLGDRLGLIFRDGDDLHPPENIAKMRRGDPLTDSDRWPWLDRVGAVLAADEARIIGCSALKRAYRDRIRQAAQGPVTFVHLAGARDVIAARLAARKGHFMPPSLLDSQFAALEPPGVEEVSITVNVADSPDAMIAAILATLEALRD